MPSRRVLWFTLLLLTLFAISPLHAQDDAISSFPIFGEGVMSVLSPDGRLLAVHENGVLHNGEVLPEYLPVRVYDVETGDLVAELTGSTDYLAMVAFSPDSASLAGLQSTGFIYLWSLPSGDLEQTLWIAPGGVRMGYMPDGTELLVQQGLPPILQIWNIESSAMVQVLTNRYRTTQEMLEAPTPPDMLVAAVPYDGGQKIISASAYGNIWRWDVATGDSEILVRSEESIPAFSIRALALTPDEQTLVYPYSYRDDESVNVLNLSTLDLTSLPAPDINTAAFDLSPDGTRVAWISAGENPELVVSALDGSAPEQRISLGSEANPNLRLPTTTLAFLPDGNRLILTIAQIESPENAAYIIQLDAE